MFKFDPETTHSLAIKALKYNYIPKTKLLKNDLISTEIFGKKISNPIGLAAGFDKNAKEYIIHFSNLDLVFVEVRALILLKPNMEILNLGFLD